MRHNLIAGLLLASAAASSIPRAKTPEEEAEEEQRDTKTLEDFKIGMLRSHDNFKEFVEPKKEYIPQPEQVMDRAAMRRSLRRKRHQR